MFPGFLNIFQSVVKYVIMHRQILHEVFYWQIKHTYTWQYSKLLCIDTHIDIFGKQHQLFQRTTSIFH